jgi:flagellar motor switch protein FliN/FliY
MAPLDEIAPLADVLIELEMELEGKIMPLRQVLAWEPGSVVWLARSAGENIDIHTGGVLLGCGEIVIIENSFGVRITDFAGGES